MASTITAHHGFRIDMIDNSTMGSGTPIALPTVTPTKVTWVTADGKYELYGSGFSANPLTGTLSGNATRVDYSQSGVLKASWDGLSLSASDVVKISSRTDMVKALIETMLPGDNVINLSSGNDLVQVGSGKDVVNGGAGLDRVVLNGKLADFTVSLSGSGTHNFTKGTDSASLTNVERVVFSDGVLALDTAGAAGTAYRLYEAALDRTPDTAGVAFWIGSLDAGGTLKDAANFFISSPEFKTKYGSLSNNGFVDQLYKNVLGRSADQGGLDYWAGKLNAGTMDRADVLVGFSESPENVKLVAADIAHGIWLG